MKKIITLLLILFSINIISQTKNKESWSFGIGLSNFSMHGDLRSIETGESNSESNLLNLGTYIYADKMLTPAFGFELKFNYSKMAGTGQEVSSTYLVAGSTPLNQTRFEGISYGGEINTIINLSGFASNPYRMKKRKLNFAGIVGIGMHRYDSKLYDINSNELLLNYGNSPSKNGSTSSMYYTSALSLKYKLTPKIDIELRQSFNLNEEDHLDAAVSSKQSLDFFFKTDLGIVFKLNSKKHDNFIWQDDLTNNFNENDYEKIINKVLKDTDGDGVIDRFDKDNNTPKNVTVYGNGIAIDSDRDGVPDYKDKTPLSNFIKPNKSSLPVEIIDTDKDGIIDSKDKCPTIYAKTSDGCLKKVDTDGDGISDKLDKCPTIFAPNGDGCPKKIKHDTDKDGIPDRLDKCPLLFAKTRNGCPKEIDADGDGISDKIDKCPNTYAKTDDGCPKIIDTDKDGIADKLDRCPTTFAKTSDGCPDTDGDGISDKLDACPETFGKTKTGCPEILDTDNDGIVDDLDQCPNVFAKTKDGCPEDKKTDTDGDGIEDKMDRCPDVFANTPNGCPTNVDTDGDGIEDVFDKCPREYANTNDGCPDNKPKTKVNNTLKTKINITPKKDTTSGPKFSPNDLIKNINEKNITHQNNAMNNALNVNDVTTSPVFHSCRDKVDEFDKKNCMITKMAKYVNENYNANNAPKINRKVRVLFIVKENGNTQVISVIGKDISADSKQELKRVIEAIPKMKPGLLNNIPVPVKYSLRFDLRN